jgi:ADP-ribose pyrophosphatase YjhB (NUDIX family)
MKKKWLSEKLYKKVFKIFPRLTVDAIIKSDEGVVLIKRGIPPRIGVWHLPGGLIRYGERVVGAVKREAFEETGLKVKVIKFVGIYDAYDVVRRIPNYHDVTLAFLARPTGGRLRGSIEGKDVRFFKILPKKIGFDHRKEINDAGIK